MFKKTTNSNFVPTLYSSLKTVQKYNTVKATQLSSTAAKHVTTSIERQINTFRDKFFFSKEEENISTFKYATHHTFETEFYNTFYEE